MSPDPTPNPYRAPQAPLADARRGPGSPAKGVILGVLTDIGGSLLAGFLLLFAYGIYLAASGASEEEIQRAATQPDPASAIGIFSFVVGFGFSMLGGYVCARVVRRAEMKWAGVVAAISITIGFGLGLGAYPLALNVVLAAVGVAAVLAGGHLGARRNARSEG